MEKTDCYYYNNLTGCCKKGLPETRCEIEGCVCYTKTNPLYQQCLSEVDPKVKKEVNVFIVAKHLSGRVDQYLVQGCKRSELKAANDALKKLLK